MDVNREGVKRALALRNGGIAPPLLSMLKLHRLFQRRRPQGQPAAASKPSPNSESNSTAPYSTAPRSAAVPATRW